jgi:alpha-glucosidase (family GH31 glycosyl hydrolase)
MKLNGNIFVGRACSNEVVYPDFFSPNAEDWWGDQLQNLHSMIQFDGLS